MSSKQIRRPSFFRGGTNSPSPTLTPPPSYRTSPSQSPSPSASPTPSKTTVSKSPLLDTFDDFIPQSSSLSLFDSANSLHTYDDGDETKCVYDLTFHLTAYDGTPIIIVPESYFDVVAQSFTAGMYGFDTESDCQNGELRIIQIYTGKEVYIFPAKVLDKLKDNMMVKFLKSKDRLKIGADIDTDCYRLRRHANMKKSQGHFDQKLKYKFTVNGAIDLQSVGRSLGETIMGLEDLALKYVKGFEGNPSNLGSYCPPTNQQYIYAANDAIVSLKIYQPLLNKQPTQRWLDINRPAQVSDQEISDQEQDSNIPQEQQEIVSKSEEEPVNIEEGVELETEDEIQLEVSEGDHVDEEPLETDETETPIVREKLTISAETMTEVKTKRKRKGKKNKKTAVKKPPHGKHQYEPRDEIEEALRTINQLPPLASKSPKTQTAHSSKFSIPDIDEELKMKLRQRVDKLKQKRVDPISLKTTSFRKMKEMLSQDRVAVKESMKDNLDDVNGILNQVKDLFDVSAKKTTLVRSGERFRAFKDLIIKDDRLMTETVDRMVQIEKELTDQDYYDGLAEVAVHLLKQNIETIEYAVLLQFMINHLKVICKKYPEKTDRILAANIMINMALDNNYVETVSEKSPSFIGNGVILKLVG
jgi:hypothetical protein